MSLDYFRSQGSRAKAERKQSESRAMCFAKVLNSEIESGENLRPESISFFATITL